MSVIVPPIKSQGIKTQLVEWINDLIACAGIEMTANWYEPFFGTGVVGFNSELKGDFIVGDTNPYIIAFYNGVKDGTITPASMRAYLEKEGALLSTAADNGYAHYREVKRRFNEGHSPYDFIFLSRAGFNGMMRFNKKGEWNIPFCKKPDRFAPAYVTKICNQIDKVSRVIRAKHWEFNNCQFDEIISKAKAGDIIYCDPPYFGRYVDYYNGWTEGDEERLFNSLSATPAHFILSTWHHNQYRSNDMIDKYWGRFNITTKDHFYHGGGKIENRHEMTEALVFNFDIQEKIAQEPTLF